MTSPGLVSVDDYLRLTDDGRFEYVDGVLIERPMATWEHAMLQVWIAGLIMRLYHGCAAGSEVRSRLREREYRVPDIAVDLRANIAGKSYPDGPLYLCVEILSPEDRLGKTFEKMRALPRLGR